MMQAFTKTCGLYLVVAVSWANAAVVHHPTYSFLGLNATQAKCSQRGKPLGHGYGTNKCPCVGIDKIRGYFSTNLDFYMVQYPLGAGASCNTWDQGAHPACKKNPPPQWCMQSWCFVDPCECELDEPPKITRTGVTYQGGPAFYSYKTCNDFDFYTLENNPDACPIQKDSPTCVSKKGCAWDGVNCKDKIVQSVCSQRKSADPATFGQDGCRCVGFGGRVNGRAILAIDNNDEAIYDPNVGSVCKAWEADSHPLCKEGGTKPGFCSQRWCYVDPCSCNTVTTPTTVMKANGYQRFQGKTVYWSYETCGSKDEWTKTLKSEYCVTQTSEETCKMMEKCTWTGKKCVGRAFEDICTEQKATGVLGIEVFTGPSSGVRPLLGIVTILGLFMV
jgi:hypothetical protein